MAIELDPSVVPLPPHALQAAAVQCARSLGVYKTVRDASSNITKSIAIPFP